MLPKSVLLALAAVPAVFAAALNPLTRDIDPGLDSESGITWTGRIFKTDTEVTTLYGDASDIYAQIIARNPNYVASEIAPEDAASMLSKRGETRSCGSGTMAVGTLTDLLFAVEDLKKLGQNCGAPRKACRRMTCKDTTATYICSEKQAAVSIPCSKAAELADDVTINCCGADGSGRSGHIYVNRDYSIWVGYGNCNHSNNVAPTRYPYPGGEVNGLCHEI